MQTGANGRSFIEAFEGLMKVIPGRPGFYTTYYDSAHVLTIGYGHTNLGNIPPHIAPGDVLSRDECDQALANDLGVFQSRVARIMAPVLLTPWQFDALVSFDFNTGALQSGSVDNKLKAGRIDAAMATLLMYTHAGGQELAGLVRRRKAERLMYLGLVDEAMLLAGAHQTAALALPALLMMPKGSPPYGWVPPE